MSSPDGRFHIVFNGEIYNFQELRRELESAGVRLRSQSDTEVLLHLYAREGAQCVHRLDGMFAFGIWDNQEQTGFLARDPLGIKPLYYEASGEALRFGSEVRVLVADPEAPRALNPDVVRDYFIWGSVQEPDTLFQGIKVLPAGHWLEWQKGRATVAPYWKLRLGDGPIPKDALATARAALEESVRRHLVSDVPVGCFLSGGIDSTALVALTRKVAGVTDLRTFSIGLGDPRMNEAVTARRTAEHFGTRHEEWRLEDAEIPRLIEAFLKLADQPSIDGFNTYCVSRLAASRSMKVVLSGVGADELFGGYSSFTRVPRLRALHSALGPFRSGAANLLKRAAPASKSRRLASFLEGPNSYTSAFACQRGIFTVGEAELLAAHYAGSTRKAPDWTDTGIEQGTPKDTVSALEISRYMRNQLLRDSDVFSMACGLELRTPFADRKLVESVAGIPADVRLAAGKQLLKQAVPELPPWVLNQPKKGFILPFAEWLRTGLSDMAGDLERRSPVPLGTWYRKWAMLSFENFLEKSRAPVPAATLAVSAS